MKEKTHLPTKELRLSLTQHVSRRPPLQVKLNTKTRILQNRVEPSRTPYGVTILGSNLDSAITPITPINNDFYSRQSKLQGLKGSFRKTAKPKLCTYPRGSFMESNLTNELRSESKVSDIMSPAPCQQFGHPAIINMISP